MTEFKDSPDGRADGSIAETAQWTYADEVSGLMDELFGTMSRGSAVTPDPIMGLATTLTKHVKDEDGGCKIGVVAKARRMDETLEPTSVDIHLDSKLYEDALQFFGVIDGVTSYVRINLSATGSLNITGRILDDKRHEIRRIGFYSSEIGTNPNKPQNTMSSQEAMDLMRKVAGRFTEYSTPRK